MWNVPAEALEVARKSLTLVPDFRPGVQAEAHLLQVLGREREALDRLADVSTRIESGIVVRLRLWSRRAGRCSGSGSMSQP